MFFFLRLAWGNIFKNLRNTVTILIAVFISTFATVFFIGYMDGFKVKIIDDALTVSGHVKAYNKQYYDNLDFAPFEYNIEWTKGQEERIKSLPGVTSVRAEINFGAMANSEDANQEAMVQAIDYNNGSGIYDRFKRKLIGGNFISSDKDMVIGVKLAKMLKLDVGDALVLLTMDQYGGINAVEGRVAGIFRNYNPIDEESLVICSLGLARKLLALPDVVTEVTVNFTDYLKARENAAALEKVMSQGVIAVPWQVSQSLIAMSIEYMDMGAFIMAAIIIFVAGLGIINSFLMNIMGRLPEFGVLRAMGLAKEQLFMMIFSESFLLGVVGSVLGIIPGTLLVYYFQLHPINYEKMGDMMQTFGGMDSTIGMLVTVDGIVITLVTGILVSMLASIYPAMVAVKKKPVEILRVLE